MLLNLVAGGQRRRGKAGQPQTNTTLEEELASLEVDRLGLEEPNVSLEDL